MKNQRNLHRGDFSKMVPLWKTVLTQEGMQSGYSEAAQLAGSTATELKNCACRYRLADHLRIDAPYELPPLSDMPIYQDLDTSSPVGIELGEFQNVNHGFGKSSESETLFRCIDADHSGVLDATEYGNFRAEPPSICVPLYDYDEAVPIEGTKCDEEHNWTGRAPRFYCDSDNKVQMVGCEDDVSVDCVLAEWGDYGDCTKECGGGEKIRTRAIKEDAEGFGTACPTADDAQRREVRECNTEECSQDCVLGAWSSWGSCNQSCGAGGTRQRVRPVEKPATGSGTCQSKAELTETQACNQHDCPQDCVLGPFGEWSSCSITCGEGGQQTRVRTISVDASAGGLPCPPEAYLTESRSCESTPALCPRDCVLGNFTAWGACTQVCGGGTQTRMQLVEHTAISVELGAKACPTAAELTEERDCNVHDCPANCQFHGSTAWSECSETCGPNGVQTKIWEATGDACPSIEDRTQTQSCNQDVLCPQSCTLGDFTPWSDCTKTCGGGSQTRLQKIAEPAVGSGSCETVEERTQTQACNEQDCPVCKCSNGQLNEAVHCTGDGEQHCKDPCDTGYKLHTNFPADGQTSCVPTCARVGQPACAELFDANEDGRFFIPSSDPERYCLAPDGQTETLLQNGVFPKELCQQSCCVQGCAAPTAESDFWTKYLF